MSQLTVDHGMFSYYSHMIQQKINARLQSDVSYREKILLPFY